MVIPRRRFYGYTNAFFVWLTFSLGIGEAYYSFGVFAPAMAQEYGWSKAAIGGVFSVMVLLLGITGPLVGAFIVRYGPRRAIYLGSWTGAVGLALLPLTSQLRHFYLFYGVVLGLAMGLGSSLSAQQIVSNWFLRRRALVMGWVLTGGGIGGFIIAPLSAALIDGLGGWRAAWLPLAGLMFLAGVVAFLFVKDKPEDVGQTVDGLPEYVPQHGEERPAPAASRVYTTPVMWEARDAVRTAPFWLMMVSYGALMWALQTIVAHQVVYLESVGISKVVAAGVLGFVAGLSTVGRVMAGWLGDRVEPRRILSVFLVLMALGVFILMNARSITPLYIYVLVFGIAYGGTFIPQPTMLVNYYGAKNFAAIFGLQRPLVTVLGAVSPLASGYIYDVTGSYTIAFGIIIVLCLVASVCALLSRPPRPVTLPAPASGVASPRS